MRGQQFSIELAKLRFMFSLLGTALGGLDGHCPPFGSVLPAPTNPSSSGPVQSAVSQFEGYFSTLTSPFTGSAVSVSVRSMHEPDHLVDLHYTPPVRQANSTTHVDGNTVYRVGSISKIFTALGILKVGIQMDDVVTDYIPEFQGLEATGEASNPAVTVSWDDITIGALASHMSGIGLD